MIQNEIADINQDTRSVNSPGFAERLAVLSAFSRPPGFYKFFPVLKKSSRIKRSIAALFINFLTSLD